MFLIDLFLPFPEYILTNTVVCQQVSGESREDGGGSASGDLDKKTVIQDGDSRTTSPSTAAATAAELAKERKTQTQQLKKRFLESEM